jgi:hypothetical protein
VIAMPAPSPVDPCSSTLHPPSHNAEREAREQAAIDFAIKLANAESCARDFYRELVIARSKLTIAEARIILLEQALAEARAR